MATNIKTINSNTVYIENNCIVIGDDRFDPNSRVSINAGNWAELKITADQLVYGQYHDGKPNENEVWISTLDYNIRAAINSVEGDMVHYEINGLGRLQLSKNDFVKAYRPDYIEAQRGLL